jgi:hypothetical protein
VLTKSTFVGIIISEAYYYKSYFASTFTRIVVLVTTIVAIGHYKRFALFCTHIRPFLKKKQGTHLNIHTKTKPYEGDKKGHKI